MDEFEFDWEVLEIIIPSKDELRRGAKVKYTPLKEDLSELEVFVPVPWHKATGYTHAHEIMERKIISYAPTSSWRKELAPVIEDKTDKIEAVFNRSLPKGEKREGRTDTEGSGDQPRVSESSGSEGERERSTRLPEIEVEGDS